MESLLFHDIPHVEVLHGRVALALGQMLREEGRVQGFAGAGGAGEEDDGETAVVVRRHCAYRLVGSNEDGSGMCGEASSVDSVSGAMMGRCKQGESYSIARDVTRDGRAKSSPNCQLLDLARCGDPESLRFCDVCALYYSLQDVARLGEMYDCLDRDLVQMTQIHCRSRAAWTSASTRCTNSRPVQGISFDPTVSRGVLLLRGTSKGSSLLRWVPQDDASPSYLPKEERPTYSWTRVQMVGSCRFRAGDCRRHIHGICGSSVRGAGPNI